MPKRHGSKPIDPPPLERCHLDAMVIDLKRSYFEVTIRSNTGNEIFNRITVSDAKKLESRLQSEGWREIEHISHQEGWAITYERVIVDRPATRPKDV